MKLWISGISNNAGEEDGFSVGNAKCIDYCMSVGTTRGAHSVMFGAVSYKGRMRISVSAKEAVLSKKAAENLANHIELELQLLLKSRKAL